MADLHRHEGDFRWEGVDVLRYKEDGTHFRDITRQVLSEPEDELPVQLRYFEIAPGGHSTLERHQHLHVVVVLRGRGQALWGTEILELGPQDVVRIPSGTWHQFRATRGEALGFLCLVHRDRDRPERPGPDDLRQILSDSAVAEFART